MAASTVSGQGGTVSFVDRQTDRVKWCFLRTKRKADEHSLQHGDLELQSTEDLSEALDVSQQAAGVGDLGGVDL